MIDDSKILKGFNSLVNANLATIGIDCIYAGYTASGGVFTPSPSESYIDFVSLGGNVSRRSVRGSETDFSRGIYQAMVYTPKSGQSNPDVAALNLISLLQSIFTQNLKITFDGQDAQIRYTETSSRLSNETHFYYVLSVYYHVSA